MALEKLVAYFDGTEFGRRVAEFERNVQSAFTSTDAAIGALGGGIDALEAALAALKAAFEAFVASAVTSVFGRTGAILPVSGDYTSSLITNLSSVAGASVTNALNTLLGLVNLDSAAIVQMTGSATTGSGVPFALGTLVEAGGYTIVSGNRIQVPSAGRYLILISMAVTNGTATADRLTGSVIACPVGNTVSNNPRMSRIGTNTAIVVTTSCNALVRITNPATEQIAVEAAGTGSDVITATAPGRLIVVRLSP